jgi:hypothetical protein
MDTVYYIFIGILIILFMAGIGYYRQRAKNQESSPSERSGETPTTPSTPPPTTPVCSYTDWSKCSATCGTAIQTRSLKPENGCVTGQVETRDCILPPCQIVYNPGKTWVYYPLDGRYRSYQSLAYSPELETIVVAGSNENRNCRFRVRQKNQAWREILVSSEYTFPGYTSTIYKILVLWISKWNKFITCTEGGFYYESSDGINWITREAPNDLFYSGIAMCWSEKYNVLLVVTNESNKMGMTEDGVQWNTVTVPDNTFPNQDKNIQWTSVCWAGDLDMFLFVGYSQSSGTTTQQGRILIFYGGERWEVLTFTTSFKLNSVCWSKEWKTFVAVGNGFVIVSSNGHDWETIRVETNNPDNPSGYNWTSVCWSAESGMFVAVSPDAWGVRMSSRDGKIWETYSMQISPGVGGCKTILWTGDRFMASNHTGGVAMSS